MQLPQLNGGGLMSVVSEVNHQRYSECVRMEPWRLRAAGPSNQLQGFRLLVKIERLIIW